MPSSLAALLAVAALHSSPSASLSAGSRPSPTWRRHAPFPPPGLALSCSCLWPDSSANALSYCFENVKKFISSVFSLASLESLNCTSVS